MISTAPPLDPNLAAAIKVLATKRGPQRFRARLAMRLSGSGVLVTMLQQTAHSTMLGAQVTPYTLTRNADDTHTVSFGESQGVVVAQPLNPLEASDAASAFATMLEPLFCSARDDGVVPQIIVDSPRTVAALDALGFHHQRGFVTEGAPEPDRYAAQQRHLARLLLGLRSIDRIVGTSARLELTTALSDHFVYPLAAPEQSQLAVLNALHRDGPLSADELVDVEDTIGSVSAATDPTWDIETMYPARKLISTQRVEHLTDTEEVARFAKKHGAQPTRDDPRWTRSRPAFVPYQEVILHELSKRTRECKQAFATLLTLPINTRLELALTGADGDALAVHGAMRSVASAVDWALDPSGGYHSPGHGAVHSQAKREDAKSAALTGAQIATLAGDPGSFEAAVHADEAVHVTVAETSGTHLVGDISGGRVPTLPSDRKLAVVATTDTQGTWLPTGRRLRRWEVVDHTGDQIRLRAGRKAQLLEQSAEPGAVLHLVDASQPFSGRAPRLEPPHVREARLSNVGGQDTP